MVEEVELQLYADQDILCSRMAYMKVSDDCYDLPDKGKNLKVASWDNQTDLIIIYFEIIIFTKN